MTLYFRVARIRFHLLALLLLAPVAASAQVNSNSSSVTLNATLAESLTVAATPANVNFALVAGAPAIASAPIAITTSWTLKATRSNVNLYAWFSTPSAALTDGASPANNIASSLVFGQVTSGLPTSYTAFTQSNTLGTASGGLELLTQAISSTNRSSNRTDNLNLKIDLTSLPQLPAGSYTGTLTLQAQAL